MIAAPLNSRSLPRSKQETASGRFKSFALNTVKLITDYANLVKAAKRGLVPTNNGFTAQSLEDLEAVLELTKRLKAGMKKRGIV